jgi:hypothetical protein
VQIVNGQAGDFIVGISEHGADGLVRLDVPFRLGIGDHYAVGRVLKDGPEFVFRFPQPGLGRSRSIVTRCLLPGRSAGA